MPQRLTSRLRASPADPVAAARMAALSGARPAAAGGWTPQGPGRHAAPAAEQLVEPPQTTRRLPPRPEQPAHHTLPAPDLAASPPPAAGPDVLADPAAAVDLPLDLGLDDATSVLERWKAGRTDPGRRGVVALALLAVLAVVLTAFVVLHGRPEAVSAPAITAAGVPVGETVAPEETGDVVVSVGGKVARPGVVTLPAGARVNDALTAAGGPTEPDAVGLLNLARRLVDGEQVLVGVEPPPGAETGPAGVPGDSRVDLNAADASGFDALSGIGPVLAERIVAWREQHGRFTSVDQLREVSGIGEAKFASIKDAVRV